MGLDFRKSLIEELERRRREIDGMLNLLYRVQDGDGIRATSLFTPDEAPVDPWPRKPRNRPQKNGNLYQEIVQLREQGLSLRAIGEHVNLSHAGVWKVLRRAK